MRSPCHQPILKRAAIRQNKKRFFSTQININATIKRLFGTISSHAHESKNSGFTKLRTSTVISKLNNRAPFSSPLRPSLTAGALPRTAGGYGIGGARYFSCTPTPPARVVQDVFAAFRLFALSKKMDPSNIMTSSNERYYHKKHDTQGDIIRQDWFPGQMSGSFVDFHLKLNFMSLSQLIEKKITTQSEIEQSPVNLNTPEFFEGLSNDYSQAMKDISVIMSDLKKFSILGDLPITLEEACILRIHLLGHDYESVERICGDLGIQRGIVGQYDDCFNTENDKMQLSYPHAPESPTALSAVKSLLRSDTRVSYQDSGNYTTAKKTVSEYSETEYFYLDKNSVDQSGYWDSEILQGSGEEDFVL